MSNSFSRIIQLYAIFIACTLSSSATHPDKIIFLHIPKTGGVTVSSLLMNEYDQADIANPNPRLVKLHAYGFHHSLYEADGLLNTTEFKLITFLRHPIDRVLSEHRYCIERHEGKPMILSGHRLPSEGDPLFTTSNIACKMLSGLDDKDPTITDDQHLCSALETLKNRLYFIGITERIEESMALLYSKLGWREPCETPHLNATIDSHDYSEELLSDIAQRNWADIVLYEYAMKLYEEQKSSIKAIVPNSYAELDINAVSNFHYTFDKSLRGFGWGYREWNHEIQSIFRWAIEQNCAGIAIPMLETSDYLIECSIYIQPILSEQFTVLINDHPILFQYGLFKDPQSMSYAWNSLVGTIPASVLHPYQENRITFMMSPPNDPSLRQFFEEDNQQQSIMANYNRGKFACQKISVSPK